MLVEDDKDFADLVKINLERLNENNKISHYVSVDQAIKDLSTAKTFNVIISDYHMDPIDGLKFLETIRKMNITVPFIIFTGVDQEELEEKSFEAGATYFIKKGTNFKQSIAELNKFLNFFVIQQKKNRAGSDVAAPATLGTVSSFNKLNHLDLILQNIEFGLFVLDLTGKIVYANKKGSLDLGWPSVEALLENKSNTDIFKILDIYNPKYFDFLTKRFSFKTGDDLFSDEMININPTEDISKQKWLLKKITPIFDQDLALQFVTITTYDLTPVMKSEFESHRELQYNLLLNNCLDLLYHIVDEQDFMDSFCKLLVEKSEYILVWIGSAEIHHNQKIVIPIASYGFETDYLDQIKVTWDDTANGNGPVGSAIKSGKPSVFNDILNNKNFSPWRDDALLRGYHSALSIPLKLHHDSEVQGTISFYSSKKDAFLERDIEVLSSLTRLLTAGLQILKTGTDLLVDENFNEFPIALIDVNIEEFFRLTNELRKTYKTIGFKYYVEKHPEIVEQSLNVVKINKVNLKALELLKTNLEEFSKNFSKTLLSKTNFDTFKEIIIALNEGKKELIKKLTLKTSESVEINSMIKLVVESRQKKFMDHVLIAIIAT